MDWTKLKLTVIIFLTGLFIPAAVFAVLLTPPEIPVLFYGTVRINNSDAPIGTVISFRQKINNNEIVRTTVSQAGKYLAETPCQEYIDAEILIKVNNLISKESQCVNVMNVPSVNLDLNLDMADIAIDGATDEINIPASIGDETKVTIIFTATSTVGGNTTATTSASGLVLTRDSANPQNKFVVTFPPNTVITGPSSWDGTMSAPQVSSINIPLPDEAGKINQTEEVINIGFSGTVLTFDKPVKILFPQMAGKKIGFSRAGADFTEIINICPENNGNSLTGGVTECKFNSGADLIVWTKHFTSFVVYSQSAKPTAVNYGGGAFVAPTPCAEVVYNGWQESCVNNIQYRNVIASSPANCVLTSAQRQDAQRPCGLPSSAPPQVLGLKIATSTEQFLPAIQNEAIIISAAQIEPLLYALTQTRDLAREKKASVAVSILAAKMSGIQLKHWLALTNFIAYGTPSTAVLGIGERAGALNSYKAAFGSLPANAKQWEDVIKIANGRWPTQQSFAAEAKAKLTFKQIYGREVNTNNQNDNAAVTIMAYGLRPSARNLISEKTAIITFKYFFKRAPVSASDWDAARAIAYSGAKR
jgi:hypothetical protein